MARNCCQYFTVGLVPMAALVLAVVFACGFILLPVFYSELVKNYVYGIVIDAGSSHTSVYVYRWQVPTTHGHTGVVEEVYHCPNSFHTTSSINSYTSDPQRAPEAYLDCLYRTYGEYYMRPIVPEKQRSYTNLYLGATAGMRLVQLDNQNVSEQIMDSIRTNLHNQSLVQYKFQEAEVLSGSVEAGSAWISANFLHHNETVFPPHYQPIGALDLGGASTQIAFEHNATTANSSYIRTERLYGVDYRLYARSFLCYGVDQAYARFLAHLVAKNNNLTTNVPNPCLFSGAQTSANSTNIYTTCVNHQVATEVFGHSLVPPSTLKHAPTSSVTFIGTGNSEQCQQYINETFDKFCATKGNCDSGQFITPPAEGHFLGFSGFYYTALVFNVTNINFTSATGWDRLNKNISTFCNLPYEQAVHSYPGKKLLNEYCFRGNFMTFLLTTGFGFTQGLSRQWSVEFVSKLRHKTLGWSLGFMLDKTNSISQEPYYKERPYTVVDLVVGMIILSILCIIFILFFVLTFYACRKALNTRSGYQNI